VGPLVAATPACVARVAVHCRLDINADAPLDDGFSARIRHAQTYRQPHVEEAAKWYWSGFRSYSSSSPAGATLNFVSNHCRITNCTIWDIRLIVTDGGSRYQRIAEVFRMARVLGIGGIFFKSPDPQKLNEWYERWLGLKAERHSGITFRPQDMPKNGLTVWNVFESSTDYFAPSAREFMFNMIVDDLTEALH
jgi:hypothetical protein